MNYGLTLRFTVTIDNQLTLGNWTKCEGLTVEWEVQEYREGGSTTTSTACPAAASTRTSS